MAIYDKIRDGKTTIQCYREAAKMSALWSGKLDQYEYLTSEVPLRSNQSKMKKQAKFTYSP